MRKIEISFTKYFILVVSFYIIENIAYEHFVTDTKVFYFCDINIIIITKYNHSCIVSAIIGLRNSINDMPIYLGSVVPRAMIFHVRCYSTDNTPTALLFRRHISETLTYVNIYFFKQLIGSMCFPVSRPTRQNH